MGTRERRQRDLDTREQQFLDTARELIRETGLLNLQMARVAEKCEYAVGTLYQHFASKEDLLMALVCADIEAHVDLYRRLAVWPAKARDRIVGLAVADMLFTRCNPEHFRISQYVFCEVVWRAGSATSRQAILEAQRPIAEIAVGIVSEAIAAGDLNPQGLTADELAVSMWALTLGMHDLAHADGMLQPLSVADPYRLMCRQLQALMNGLEWQPRMDLADGAALDALIGRIRNEVFHDFDCKS